MPFVLCYCIIGCDIVVQAQHILEVLSSLFSTATSDMAILEYRNMLKTGAWDYLNFQDRFTYICIHGLYSYEGGLQLKYQYILFPQPTRSSNYVNVNVCSTSIFWKSSCPANQLLICNPVIITTDTLVHLLLYSTGNTFTGKFVSTKIWLLYTVKCYKWIACETSQVMFTCGIQIN